jgi:hypothetical protein
VIKVSRLMVLSSRISRPRQWQADMDVRWKFRQRRPGSGSFGQDGLGRVAVGDLNPNADPGGTAGRPPTCGFEWTDECSRTLILPWSCTRELGHQGQHLAGTGEWVAAKHPQ